MTTTVTITGSGTPMPTPGRAGPGALIRHGDTAIQIDAGRATALRLVEAGLALPGLDALLVTHHHSDHMLGITDLVLARWISNGPGPCPSLPIHCPAGPAETFVGSLFDQLGADIENRRAQLPYVDAPEPTVIPFEATAEPTLVADYGEIAIHTVSVDHGGLEPAVCFRFATPDGVILISGDTRVCGALEQLAAEADVLVHEAFSPDLLARRGMPAPGITNFSHHHADVGEVGALAARLDVSELVITHMIPSPMNAEETAVFANAIRGAGFVGDLTIADDLFTATIGESPTAGIDLPHL